MARLMLILAAALFLLQSAAASGVQIYCLRTQHKYLSIVGNAPQSLELTDQCINNNGGWYIYHRSLDVVCIQSVKTGKYLRQMSESSPASVDGDHCASSSSSSNTAASNSSQSAPEWWLFREGSHCLQNTYTARRLDGASMSPLSCSEVTSVKSQWDAPAAEEDPMKGILSTLFSLAIMACGGVALWYYLFVYRKKQQRLREERERRLQTNNDYAAGPGQMMAEPLLPPNASHHGYPAQYAAPHKATHQPPPPPVAYSPSPFEVAVPSTPQRSQYPQAIVMGSPIAAPPATKTGNSNPLDSGAPGTESSSRPKPSGKTGGKRRHALAEDDGEIPPPPPLPPAKDFV